jgi:ketosteroid isomerase-like protein
MNTVHPAREPDIAGFLRPQYSNDDLSAVRQALARMLLGDLAPILGLLAENVAFQVVVGGAEPRCITDWGRQPVVDYMKALGGMMAFWQVDYAARGDQLIAWGKEDFTIEPCGIEASSQFALVFDLADGRIVRLVIVEDLPAFIRKNVEPGIGSSGQELDLASYLAQEFPRPTLAGRSRPSSQEIPQGAERLG